jgi:hypothetical protein
MIFLCYDLDPFCGCHFAGGSSVWAWDERLKVYVSGMNLILEITGHPVG